MDLKNNKRAKEALFIGLLCSISYLAVYIARNILSAVTPQMIDAGYSESFIGSISSIYFVCYAVGQLINGAIGWSNLILVWLGLMIVGIIIALPYKKTRKEN
jgi:sugar phosphate permease